MFPIKDEPLTNQEWILIFAGYIALCVAFTAIICIVYKLIRAVRLEEERHEAQVAKVCKNSKVKAGKFVVNVEAEPIETAQTQSSFTNVSLDSRSPIVFSSALCTAKSLFVEHDSSALMIKFEKDFRTAMGYDRILAEECLMEKFRQQLAEREMERRKITFVEKPEILPESPETLSESTESSTPPKQLSPIAEPKQLSSIAEPKQLSPIAEPKKLSPIAEPMDQSAFAKLADRPPFTRPVDQSTFAKPIDQSTFAKPLAQSLFSKLADRPPFVRPIDQSSSVLITSPQQLKPARKKLDRCQLPPLKRFTPPRALTPSSSLDFQPWAPRKTSVFKKPMFDSRKLSSARKLHFTSSCSSLTRE